MCDGEQLIAQLAHSLLDDDHMNFTGEVVGQSPLLALTTLFERIPRHGNRSQNQMELTPSRREGWFPEFTARGQAVAPGQNVSFG